MNKQRIRILMLGTPTIICGMLASAGYAVAQSDSETSEQSTVLHLSCSNRTISGDYGGTATGVLIGVPGLPQEAQFRSVGVSHFDGKGNFTGMEHTVVNGASVDGGWTANSGTYAVNPDCTGTLVLNTPNSPFPLNLFFVVVRQGREFHTVLSTSAIATSWIKVENHTDQRRSQ